MKINYKGKEITMPDFLIVGAAKSGTTSLFYYLSKHPDIFSPAEKEPHFFSFYDNEPNFNGPSKMKPYTSIDAYTSLFEKMKSNKITGEGSTSYLYDYKTTIETIKKIYGEKYNDLKIIILLRNPSTRAWSQYWQFRKFYFEPLRFEDTIKEEVIQDRLKNNWSYFYDYMGFGRYYNQVKAYQDNFNNVKVVLQEELLSETSIVVNEILEFLEVSLLNDNFDTDRRFNPSGKPKNNFYGKVWGIKNRTNFFKIFKGIIPLKLRKKITYYFMERAMDRQKMPQNLKASLSVLFKQDNQNLYELVKNKKILKW